MAKSIASRKDPAAVKACAIADQERDNRASAKDAPVTAKSKPAPAKDKAPASRM